MDIAIMVQDARKHDKQHALHRRGHHYPELRGSIHPGGDLDVAGGNMVDGPMAVTDDHRDVDVVFDDLVITPIFSFRKALRAGWHIQNYNAAFAFYSPGGVSADLANITPR